MNEANDFSAVEDLIVPEPDADWQHANQDWRKRDPAGRSRHQGRLSDKASGTREPIRLISPVDLASHPASAREWIVDGWLPIGCVTANYGNGGEGKTLLSQQLMTACATRKPWCGLEVRHCRSLALFAEDDEDELHRRQEAICCGYGVSMNDLEPIRWLSGVGGDNTLVICDSDGARVTELYHEILRCALEHRAEVVVLDTAADVFAGNENDRHQVRRFISYLNGLALEIGGAVLLNAHPSRPGLTTGELDGGSTAWSNSVRSRWSLGRAAASNSETSDPNARILTRRKANYATIGDSIQLRWEDGILKLGLELTPSSSLTAAACEAVFLTLLDRRVMQGRRVSDNPHASNYAPRAFANEPGSLGHTNSSFEAAMRSLFAAGEIAVNAYGRPGDARQQIVRLARAS